ncbi:hypothetical protein ACIQCR_24190 [Streptomyces sp. NPDC093249]|uniref:hypothetical protein n=1 Tax=unclassified Streptomyces TaxID=2593676 RepID=UPI0038300D2C
MHHHGYTWVGEKKAFDDEALRRPPPPHPPPYAAEEDVPARRLAARYRAVSTEFGTTDLPPLQTAHWLMKPSETIKGTWQAPEKAGAWIGRRLAEAAPRFATDSDREATRLASLVKEAAARLAWGGDVSLGHYLIGTLFHSVALVTCSPNRSSPELPCPLCHQG